MLITYNGLSKKYEKSKVDSYTLDDVKEINKDKRFQATFSDGKKTKFGQIGGSTYIDHKDEIKRKNYISRHKQDLKTNNPQRAGFLSLFLLWGSKTNMKDAITDYNKRLRENDWKLF